MTEYINQSPAALVEESLRTEGRQLSETGSLTVFTGKRTGRSANDKLIVMNDTSKDTVAWGEINKPIAQDKFDSLYERVQAYLNERDMYVFEGYAGVQPEHAKDFRIVCEMPSQAFFIGQLLSTSNDGVNDPFTILVAPNFKCDPEQDGTNSSAAIIIDYMKRQALIAGTAYSGEIKKTVFSIMNFFLPTDGILPMHCSANMGRDGRTAVFFGLSGTGKTTLSADPSRLLIGDDEHGWADDEVFNFETGCYAKCIDLDPEREPDIYDAIRFGAMTENVVMDERTRKLLFADSSITENTRVAYPLSHIKNIEPSRRGQVPRTVVFLTADAFGVLPPISKLSLDQAMFYFLSGYTSKVAGTEVGVTDPEPTFSTCFGEPFLPLKPEIYAQMLKEKVAKAKAQVFLVNTGWNGRGERMPLPLTRAMLDAALNGQLDDVGYWSDPVFKLNVPSQCPGCPTEILDPRHSWENENAYIEAANKLARMFRNNFDQKYPTAGDDIRNAGPTC